MPTSPYSAAYQKYTEKKLQNAHTLYEILRIRPDWRGEVLIKKFQQLKGNEPLTIGKIPKEFPNNHFSIITNYLRGQVETGLKLAKKIDSLTLDNRKYDFEFFTDFPVMILCGETGVIQIFRNFGIPLKTAVVE